MAYDALTMRAVTVELNQIIGDGRINRITQTSRFAIVLHIHARGQNHRLLLSAHPQQGSVFLTTSHPDPVETTPMFCLLLRKHLEGFRIDRVFQKDLERVMVLECSGKDETGLLTKRWLIAEIMGKHSNLILAHPDEGLIIDSIRRVTHQISRVREILPGTVYAWPPPQDRALPLALSGCEILPVLRARDENERVWKALLASFEGLGPLSAKEICARANIETDQRLSWLTPAEWQALEHAFLTFWQTIAEQQFCPTLVIHPKENRAVAYAPYQLAQYPKEWQHSYPAMNDLLDEYFTKWSGVDRLEEARGTLQRTVLQHIDRIGNRLAAIQTTLLEAEKADELRAWGEIILANIHRIRKGDLAVAGPDYRVDAQHLVTVPLDPQKTPAENAQIYFRCYNKAKKSLEIQSEHLTAAQTELQYLESTAHSIDRADSPALLREIRSELQEEGYIKEKKAAKRRQQQEKSPAQPLELQDSDGYRILIGRNNRQNDLVTMRLARSEDLWLHAKDIPGSHVIIQLQSNSDFNEHVIARAAGLAAYFSQARQGNKVPVDYTLRKYVRKPRGAKPGMVIYDHQKTILAAPLDPETIKR